MFGDCRFKFRFDMRIITSVLSELGMGGGTRGREVSPVADEVVYLHQSVYSIHLNQKYISFLLFNINVYIIKVINLSTPLMINERP